MDERTVNRSDVVFVGGMGLSGSSAVFDFLLGHRQVRASPTELRYLADPGGLVSMRAIWKEANSVIQITDAVERFRKLAETLNRKYTTRYWGYAHYRHMGSSFMVAVEHFLEEIVEFQYQGMWCGALTKRYLLARLIRKVSRANGDRLIERSLIPMRVAKPLSVFDAAAGRLIRSSSGFEDNGGELLLIDEPSGARHFQHLRMFLPGARCVFVVRNPLDLYCEGLRFNFRIFPREPSAFVDWYSRESTWAAMQARANPDFLVIKFEDFVMAFDTEGPRLRKALEIDGTAYSSLAFDPRESKRNIGLWAEGALERETARIIETGTVY